MRLLIVGINYAPEEAGNAPYTAGFAEHMAAIGHEVHVLTGAPHYPGWKKKPVDEASEINGIRNGVQIHRRWHYVPGRQSVLRRALYEASFLSNAPFLASLPRPDAIVGVVPTLSDGVLAMLLSKRFAAPYGLIFQDLMGPAASQSGIAGGGSVGGLVRAGEGIVARHAASVAIVSESFRPYLESLGVPSEEIVRVRNWSRIPAASAPRELTRQAAGWLPEAFVCLHAGNMGYKQGLANVIECARLARDVKPELLLVLAGDGSQRADLEKRAAAYQLPNLRFLPTLPDQEYADLLAAADALILHQSSSVIDMSFPSKVSSYVASGTPIVAAVAPGGGVARELEDAGAAVVVAPDRPDVLLDAIGRVSHDEVLRRRLLNASTLYSGEFIRENALHELESFVGRVAMGEGHEQGRELLERAA